MGRKRLHLCHSSSNNSLKLQRSWLTQDLRYLPMHLVLQLQDKDCALGTQTRLKTPCSLMLSLVLYVEASSTTTCRRAVTMQTLPCGTMIVMSIKPEILTPLVLTILQWTCMQTAPAMIPLTEFICTLESRTLEQARKQIVVKGSMYTN